jgi:hypothetical protein
MKLNDKVYDILKWLGLAFFPALGILLQTVLPVWGVDPSLIKALTVTCNAIGVFIAAIIGVSQVTLAKEKLEMIEETADIQDGVAEDEDQISIEDLTDEEI